MPRRILRDNADVTVQIIDINKLDGRTEACFEGSDANRFVRVTGQNWVKLPVCMPVISKKFSFLMISYVTGKPW